jgi:HEAT repeat protein/tetratricopeptide (TPR) repeat protein
MRSSDFTSQINEKTVNRLIISLNERYDQTQQRIETKYDMLLKNLRIKLVMNKTLIDNNYNQKLKGLSTERDAINSEINLNKKEFFGAFRNRKNIKALDSKHDKIFQNYRELRTEQIHKISQLDFVISDMFMQIIQKEAFHKKEKDIKNKTNEKTKIVDKIMADYDQLCMINEINRCSVLITQEPETAYNYYLRGEIYSKYNDNKAAVNEYVKAIERDPDDPVYQFKLARALTEIEGPSNENQVTMRFVKNQEDVIKLVKTLDISIRNHYYIQLINKQEVVIEDVIKLILTNVDDYERKIEYLRRSLVNQLNNKYKLYVFSRLLYGLGECYYHKQDYKKSIYYYSLAKRHDSNLNIPHNILFESIIRRRNKGIKKYENGHFEEAITIFTGAILERIKINKNKYPWQLAPWQKKSSLPVYYIAPEIIDQNADCIFWRGKTYYAQREMKKAGHDFNKAIHLTDNNKRYNSYIQGLRTKANSLYHNKEYLLAIEECKVLLEIRLKFPRMLYGGPSSAQSMGVFQIDGVRSKVEHLIDKCRVELQKIRGELVREPTPMERNIKELLKSNVIGRIEAAEALGEIGDSRAIWSLSVAFKDRDIGVRIAVVEALGKIGEPALDRLTIIFQSSHGRVLEVVIEVLGKIGEPAIKPLLLLLNNDARSRPITSVKAFVKIGQPAVIPLINNLKHRIPKGRWGSAKSLGEIGDPRAVEPLIQALNDSNIGVRIAVVEALGKIGSPRAIVPLIDAIRDEVYQVRVSVVEALGEIGDPRALEPLSHALTDEVYQVRVSVVEALGEIGGPGVVEPLSHAVNDRDIRVRIVANRARARFSSYF